MGITASPPVQEHVKTKAVAGRGIISGASVFSGMGSLTRENPWFLLGVKACFDRGSSFRLKWFPNGGAPLTQNCSGIRHLFLR